MVASKMENMDDMMGTNWDVTKPRCCFRLNTGGEILYFFFFSDYTQHDIIRMLETTEN